MNTGDILGAESLLATVVAILYSLWYPEIGGSLKLERRDMLADREPAIAALRSALMTKALPLVLVATLPPVVFAPDTWAVLGRAVTSLTSAGGQHFSYDSIDAAFLVVWVLLVVLAVVAAGQVKALWLKDRDFRKDT